MANWEFEVPPYVSVFCRYVHLTLPRVEDKKHCLIRDMYAPLAFDRKKGRQLSRGMSRELRKSFFLAPERLFWGHMWIARPLRSLLGNCNFCIIFFSSLSYFYFYFYAIDYFISYLIPIFLYTSMWGILEESILFVRQFKKGGLVYKAFFTSRRVRLFDFMAYQLLLVI